jgi:hypothetical protein
MSKLTFIEGQKVRHLKTDNIYIIESTAHLQRDDKGEWKAAIIYRPANSISSSTFSRTAASFSEAFVNA